MNGTVTAFAINGSGCAFSEFPIAVTATYGLVHTFLAYVPGGLTGCVAGAEHIDLDFVDGDQDCVGCISDHFFTSPDPTSTGTFYVGDAILSTVTATMGQTGNLRFHATASDVVTIDEVRLYTAAGNLIDVCNLNVTTGTSAEGNLFDVSGGCEISNGAPPASFVVGTTYKGFFRGKYAQQDSPLFGTEYEQLISFMYVATP